MSLWVEMGKALELKNLEDLVKQYFTADNL